MSFNAKFFDNDLSKYLELRLHASNNANLDLITATEEVDHLIEHGFHMGDSASPELKNTLWSTINEDFGGLQSVRTLPLWRSHIDLAIAVFINR